MSKGLKVTGIIVGVVVLLFALRIVNTYVYPFKKASPNFSDVETAFAKLQFPTEWQEISSSENRGLHGRNCPPIDNSGCFSKSKTFKVPESITPEQVETLLIEVGCTGAVKDIYRYSGEVKDSTNFSCSTGGSIKYTANLRGPTSEVGIGVNTY